LFFLFTTADDALLHVDDDDRCEITSANACVRAGRAPIATANLLKTLSRTWNFAVTPAVQGPAHADDGDTNGQDGRTGRSQCSGHPQDARHSSNGSCQSIALNCFQRV
jgi:hypothetical protein